MVADSVSSTSGIVLRLMNIVNVLTYVGRSVVRKVA